MADFSFKILKQDKMSRARAGLIKTARGKIETPYLVPVATRGNIISLTNNDIKNLKIQCLLANTYHMHLMQKNGKVKDLHKTMKFKKPIITDSGGFQAFSLGAGRQQNMRKIGFFPGKRNTISKSESYAVITKRGVKFKSLYDGSTHFMGPKESMHIQKNLGADIIMAFDECTSPLQGKDYIKSSMERSHAWELESLKYKSKKQAIYGIIHGGWFKSLRLKSARFITSLPFEGIAIGGSLGKNKKDMYKILDWIIPVLDSRPRHMLGIGWIDDIFECVERGIDTFDCVQMTRVARHGHLYISPKSGGNIKNKFEIRIRKKTYEKDPSPIDSECKCQTCKNYSRSDINKMLKNKREKYQRAATIHNIHFVLNLMQKIRESIKNDTFQKLKNQWLN